MLRCVHRRGPMVALDEAPTRLQRTANSSYGEAYEGKPKPT